MCGIFFLLLGGWRWTDRHLFLGPLPLLDLRMSYCLSVVGEAHLVHSQYQLRVFLIQLDESTI